MCGSELHSLPEGVQRVSRFLQDAGHPHAPQMLIDQFDVQGHAAPAPKPATPPAAGAAVALAALVQDGQFLLQQLQFCQALAHVAQVVGHGGGGGTAVLRAVPVQIEQDAHLVQRHVHRPTHADEAQPVDIGTAVAAVGVVLALGRRQQPLFFIETDIGRAHPAVPGGFADA